MSGIRIEGNTTGNVAEVNSSNQLKIVAETNPATNPSNVGAMVLYSRNDEGAITGSPFILSPETDADYRLRVGLDTELEDETFNYTAQNTGKHNNQSTTMTFSYTTGGLITNGSSITTTTTGVSLATYAMFPMLSNGSNLYCQMDWSFSQQPTSNTIIDFGMFLRPTSNPYAPTDGVYFRLNSSGLIGVVNHNTTETTTSVLDFSYSNNAVHKYTIVASNNSAEFWIDDELYATINTPTSQGQPFMSTALPFTFRHVITGGTAGSVLQATLRGYGISIGGLNIPKTLGEIGNAMFGSYQGLSGGTMGSLASYANSANPTPAVPTNTTSTVLTALGGQGWETDTLAVNTDGVIMSYQVPAGTVSIQGRRLKLNGIKIDSFIQTALTGGGYNAQFSLCFGHTSVSLATTEAVTTKAPRRIALGAYSVASGLAALTQLPTITLNLQNPIYVNPGEFIAIAKKKIGTAPSAGVVAYLITLDYSWE